MEPNNIKDDFTKVISSLDTALSNSAGIIQIVNETKKYTTAQQNEIIHLRSTVKDLLKENEELKSDLKVKNLEIGNMKHVLNQMCSRMDEQIKFKEEDLNRLKVTKERLNLTGSIPLTAHRPVNGFQPCSYTNNQDHLTYAATSSNSNIIENTGVSSFGGTGHVPVDEPFLNFNPNIKPENMRVSTFGGTGHVPVDEPPLNFTSNIKPENMRISSFGGTGHVPVDEPPLNFTPNIRPENMGVSSFGGTGNVPVDEPPLNFTPNIKPENMRVSSFGGTGHVPVDEPPSNFTPNIRPENMRVSSFGGTGHVPVDEPPLNFTPNIRPENVVKTLDVKIEDFQQEFISNNIYQEDAAADEEDNSDEDIDNQPLSVFMQSYEKLQNIKNSNGCGSSTSHVKNADLGKRKRKNRSCTHSNCQSKKIYTTRSHDVKPCTPNNEATPGTTRFHLRNANQEDRNYSMSSDNTREA